MPPAVSRFRRVARRAAIDGGLRSGAVVPASFANLWHAVSSETKYGVNAANDPLGARRESESWV